VSDKSAKAPWQKDQADGTERVEGAPVPEDRGVVPVDSAQLVEEGELPEGTLVARQQTFSSNVEDLEYEDLQIPMLRLGQMMTPEVVESQAKMGQWLLTGHDPVDDARIVILAFNKNRVRRIGQGRDSTVVCRSPDAKQGYGDPGTACKECPFSQWQEVNGKRTIPCTLVYSYQAYSLTHGALCLVNFQKTGMQAAKLINVMMSQRGIGKFAIHLTHTKERGPAGTYAQPSVTPATVTEDELAVALGALPTY
jgi:hypothetical protein